MFRILKVILLGWLGKKAFDYATTEDEAPKAVGNRQKRNTRGRAKHA